MEESAGGLSATQAVFPMVSSIMGAGVISMSLGVQDLGYLLGPLILCVVSLLSLFTLYALVFCASKMNKKDVTYFDVCKETHPLLGYAAEFVIALQGYGCCLTYFIILKRWIAEILKISVSGAQDLFYSAAIMAPLFLMAAQESLEKLQFATILCTLSVSYLSLMVVIYYGASLVYPIKTVSSSLSGSIDPMKKYAPMATNTAIASGIPTFLFALGCHQNMVRIFASLEKKTVKTGVSVAACAVLIATIVFGSVGTCGYLTLGHHQKMNILDSLSNPKGFFHKVITEKLRDRKLILLTVARIAMVCVLLAGFPVQLHPTRDSFKTFISLLPVETSDRLLNLALTALICLSVLGISIATSNFELFMKIIGATATCYVMYLLPSICFVSFAEKKNAFYYLSMAITAASVALSAASIWDIASSTRR